MANTLKFGNGNWATKEGSTLAYNDENDNYKPLPFTFTRASNATVVNKDGLIETVGNGIPRIDFAGSEDGAMLLEPQRTNLETKSNSFSTWNTLINVTATSNYIVSPDGTSNATRLQFTSNGYVWNTGQDISSTLFTISCYAKRNDTGTESVGFFVNGSGVVNSAWAITSEWKRFTYTYTSTNVSKIGIAGESGADVSVFGFQIEKLGSYPTSYIPTQGSAVTRVVENTKIVNSPILQATNQFTLFFDAKDFVNYGTTFANIMFSLGAGESPYDAGSGIHIYNKIWYYFNGSSAVTLGNCYNATTDSKFAIAYDGTKFTRYANGVKLGTNTVSASMSNWDTITNGQLSYSGVDRVFDLADLKLYNTALSDSELAELTTI